MFQVEYSTKLLAFWCTILFIFSCVAYGDHREAKALLKEALQAEVGLPVYRNIPLIGFIGRLEEQKGSDILSAAIPKFINENVQIIVLVSDEIKETNSPPLY